MREEKNRYSMDTDERRFYVKASFVLEVSYVMAFFLFGLVTVIGFVYRLHGKVIAEYVVHYSSLRASHMETVYEKDGMDIERIYTAANEHIQKIGILQGSRVHVRRNVFDSISEVSASGEYFSIKKGINNPENFMRMITMIEGIQKVVEKNKEKEKPDAVP